MIKLSVLTTVYNREKLLSETIESVLNSSFADFEYIIVDDNSQDNSFEIVKTYAEQDKRIKVFRNEKNLGDYPNRNQAALYASGKYLKYIDSDDLLYKHSLAIMVDAMEMFPEAGVGLCQGYTRYFPRPFPYLDSSRDAYYYHYTSQIGLDKGPGESIISREKFWNLGGFPPTRMISDGIMWLKLAAEFPVVRLPPDLIWRRGHQASETYLRKNNNVRFNWAYDCYWVAKNGLLNPSCPLENPLRAKFVRKLELSQIVYLTKGLLFDKDRHLYLMIAKKFFYDHFINKAQRFRIKDI